MTSTRIRWSRPRAMLAAAAVGALVLTACGSGGEVAGGDPDGDGQAQPTAGDTGQDGPGTAATTPDQGDDTEPGGDYQSTAVSDAVAIAPDGSRFSPSDFAGRTVFVETFATWCSKCRRQLGDTNQAASQAGDDAVFLILSVETDLDPSVLTDYASSNGFDNLEHFGVLTAESLATFVDQFGRPVASAPSTPKFTIAPDGTLSELTTGFESVEEILAQLDA